MSKIPFFPHPILRSCDGSCHPESGASQCWDESHFLTKGPRIGVGREVVHQGHLDRKNLERKFFDMRAGIVGMGIGADEYRRDKNSSHDPYHYDVFDFALYGRKKKEHRIEIQKIPVGKRSPTTPVVVRHENDVDEYLCEDSSED